MATHCSILAYRISWTEEPVGYRPWGGKESDTTGRLTYSSKRGEMERVWPSCLFLSHRLIGVYSSTEGQFRNHLLPLLISVTSSRWHWNLPVKEGDTVHVGSIPVLWIHLLPHRRCWEDLLEEEMATHSSILACKVLWTEEPGRMQSMESQRVGQDRVQTHTVTHTHNTHFRHGIANGLLIFLIASAIPNGSLRVFQLFFVGFFYVYSFSCKF